MAAFASQDLMVMSVRSARKRDCPEGKPLECTNTTDPTTCPEGTPRECTNTTDPTTCPERKPGDCTGTPDPTTKVNPRKATASDLAALRRQLRAAVR